jgi:hypothetical protein
MFAAYALGDVVLVKHASRHEQVSMPLDNDTVAVQAPHWPFVSHRTRNG